ncbi:GGDEF domain-containing protein [Paraglaciecola sp. 2405UD69-4]|uniref:GGDEF domain-containing protein n=1 Tax=Paraglaciecola sp. 2405UD69-4 TaxID=3391836 RepID=UPI0039C98584
MTIFSRVFFIVKLCASIATLGALLFYDSIPKRTLQLYPQPNLYVNDFVDSAKNGLSEITWINTDKLHWVCELKESSVYRYCGVSISWSPPPHQALDLSIYDGLKIGLQYRGKSDYVRIFIQNSHPQMSAKNNLEFAKFNSTTTAVPNDNNTIDIHFRELRVADWWVDNFQIAPENTKPDVSEALSVGIDLPYLAPLGFHEFSLQSITAEGVIIDKESMYLAIILIWAALISLEVVSKNVQLNKRLQVDSQKFSEMKQQTAIYKERAETDMLTGVYNRDGLNQVVNNLKSIKLLHQYALVVLDLDHFKAVNDEHGHTNGDRVLQECVQTLKQHMRSYDILARWGGEEFVILFHNQNKVDIISFIEKTRINIEQERFLNGKCASTTISIGATQICKSDLFENAFLRADKALYQAKEEGRNRFIIL